MENREAIMTLQAHVVFACEKAGLSKAAVKEVEDALDTAISALEKQEEDRWIPVTEKLPEEDGDYLVTNFVCDKLYVEESAFIICDNGDVFWTSQNVIAWMPKPEPYKAEEES